MSQAAELKIAHLQRDVHDLKQQVQELQRRLDAVTQKRGPGRPRKKPEAA